MREVGITWVKGSGTRRPGEEIIAEKEGGERMVKIGLERTAADGRGKERRNEPKRNREEKKRKKEKKTEQ